MSDDDVMTADGMRPVVLSLPEKTAHLLETLSSQGSVEEVLELLASLVADGVRRPGSWERGWIRHAFGDDFEGRLEVDPEASWRCRPKQLQLVRGCDECGGVPNPDCRYCRELYWSKR